MTESRVGERPAEFWNDVYADYLANVLTLKAIRIKHDLTEGEFNYAMIKFGWKRRYLSPVGRQTILKRLFRLVDQMTAKLEAEMTIAGEKEVNVLTRLVSTMGKLIEMEDAPDKAKTPRQTKDMHDIRNKLVRRIEELKRG